MSKGRPRTRIAILDRDRLRGALTGIIHDKFDGQLTKAANAMNIERSFLGRLLNGVAKSVSVAELAALRHSLSREEFLDVERAVYPVSVAELLMAFDAWVAAESDRALRRDALPNTVTGKALMSVTGWETQRILEYHHLLEEVSAKFPDLVSAFDEFLEKRKHFQNRGDLAYVRILAPLLDSIDSGLVERRWQELSDSELRRFVEAGIDRERIVLDRPPDLQRAQEMARRDPLDFIALYGAMWDARAFIGGGTHVLIKKCVAARLRDVALQKKRTVGPPTARSTAD